MHHNNLENHMVDEGVKLFKAGGGMLREGSCGWPHNEHDLGTLGVRAHMRVRGPLLHGSAEMGWPPICRTMGT